MKNLSIFSICCLPETLRVYFSTFGTVKDVNVKYTQDRMGNLRDTAEQMRSRGFGFVLFESSAAVESVGIFPFQYLVYFYKEEKRF